MARLLGPSDYGTLVVLFSFIYILSVPSETIQNITATYTSKFYAKNKAGKIKCMFIKVLKKGFYASLILFILLLPISFLASKFLKIEFNLFVVTSLLVFLFVSVPLIRGILQGKKSFFKLGVNMISESSFKLALSVLAVLIGWKIYGALAGVILASVITFVLGMFFIKDLMKEKEERENFSEIYSFSLPYFIAILSIVLIYSLDVILAKRFFSPEIAGKYAVASMLGKMIFFGTSAVGKVMLPLSSERFIKKEKTSYLIRNSIKIIGLVTFTALAVFLLFPSQIISLLFGKQYLEISGILFYIGLALTFLSFTNLIILYGLSINRIKKSSFSLLIFVILEIIALSIFHYNLAAFSIAFLITNIILFLYSLMLVKR